jgi:hypothetical protein
MNTALLAPILRVYMLLDPIASFDNDHSAL